MERRDERMREERLERERTEVAGRLRRVCGDMTEQEFEVLIADIAEVNVRFRQRVSFEPRDWGSGG